MRDLDPMEKGMSHMARSYLPTLVRVLHRTCTYIIRYRETILENLPEGSEAALDLVVTACTALTDLIEIPVGT